MIGSISLNKIIIQLSSLQNVERYNVFQNKTVLVVLGEEEQDDENRPTLHSFCLHSTAISDDSSSMSLPSSPLFDYDSVLSPLPFLSQVSTHCSPVCKSPVSLSPLSPISSSDTTTMRKSTSSITINLIAVDDSDSGAKITSTTTTTTTTLIAGGSQEQQPFSPAPPSIYLNDDTTFLLFRFKRHGCKQIKLQDKSCVRTYFVCNLHKEPTKCPAKYIVDTFTDGRTSVLYFEQHNYGLISNPCIRPEVKDVAISQMSVGASQVNIHKQVVNNASLPLSSADVPTKLQLKNWKYCESMKNMPIRTYTSFPLLSFSLLSFECSLFMQRMPSRT
jgi:hypothetical protein